ncbi:MAG: CpaF family protein [Bacilli bacterium]|nr:CpaF family protein [Bacilli bacterium]
MKVKKNSWFEEFEISEQKTNNNYSKSITNDYDIFKDKELLDKFRNTIIQELIDNQIPDEKLLTQYINEEIDRITEGYDLSNVERNHIFNLIENEINGFGPITELLEDKNVTEIMVNGPDEVYIEVDGQLIRDDSVSFINDEHIIRTIQRIVQPLGRTIDSTNPMVDSHLPDGSRINAIIPPLSVKGPVMTIRKFKESMSNIDSLIGNGTLTPYMARFMDACVEAKLNIIVCGGTGSGKTTLLNVLSNFINPDERIITIEDAVELKLKQTHVISLETRNVNYEREGEVTIRDLVRNSLRMRPDRIIVGEVRGEEAFDMLQAMNTGHDGSLTTLHANSAIDALNRLETMILMGGIDIPLKAVRDYIENAIDIVINIERLGDGRRKVTSISEIVGFDGENIILKDIFAFRQNGLTDKGEVNGEFILYNYVPLVYRKIRNRGVHSVDDIFEPIEKDLEKKNKKKKED